MKQTLIAFALLTSFGCTAVGASAGAGLVQWHNIVADDEDDWNYLTPVLVGMAVGVVIDLLMVRAAGKRFGGFAAPDDAVPATLSR